MKGPGRLLGLLATAALLALAPLPSAGAPAAAHRLSLAIEPGLEEEARSFLRAHPLPEGWTTLEGKNAGGAVGGSGSAGGVAGGSGSAGGAMSGPGSAGGVAGGARRAGAVFSLGWTQGRQGPRAAGPGSGEVVLETRWLVAVVDFADPRYEATREEALAIGLSPLEELWLPGRALPVDGLFPGERGYPFTRELVARVRASDPEEARVLSLWLEASREPGLAGTARSASQESPTQERPWLLGAVGDIQIGPDEAPLLFQGRRGLRALFGDVLGELERPELLVGNLEGPVTSGGLPNPRKRFQFRFPPGTTAALAAAGFDLLLFANNHVLDYGEEGLLSTLEDSRQSGLPLVGAGRNEDEALGGASLVAPGGGARLRFFGFARYPREARGFTTEEAEAGAAKPGTNSDEAATMEAIREARAAGEVVVLLCHGGNEYRFDPSEEIRTRYRGFIDAGASLVLASHPHVLQGVEAYHDGLIAYSLGNFLFTGESEPFMAEEGGMLRILVYKGRICGLDLLPIFSGYYGTSKSGLPRDTLKAFAARTRILSGK